MKKLTIELTAQELKRLENLGKECNMPAANIIAIFVADLTGSERSGGSDERLFADQWLERQDWWQFRKWG